VLLDHRLDSHHSLSDHTLNELGSLVLHLHEFSSVALDILDLFARHLGTVGSEFGHTPVHESDYLLDSVEFRKSDFSAFLGLASLCLDFHVLNPGSVVALDS